MKCADSFNVVKLMYYYQFRYFGTAIDSFLVNMLADINMRLQGRNKLAKGSVITEIKRIDRNG